MELNQDLIEEGKALAVKCESAERMTAETRFELGRWINRAVPQQTGNNQHTSTATTVGELLKAYAEAIGFSSATLEQYRDVTIAWGDDDPSGLSWTVARKLAYRTDRMSLIDSVFQMFGKVTSTTIDAYETHLRDENRRRQQMLEQVPETDNYEEEWDDEVEDETTFIYDPVQPPINLNQNKKHGFSGPVRKLFSVVEHVRAAKALFVEESIPSVDFENDEHFEEILSACDTIVTEIIDYREMVVAKRVKAGLSPEVG